MIPVKLFASTTNVDEGVSFPLSLEQLVIKDADKAKIPNNCKIDFFMIEISLCFFLLQRWYVYSSFKLSDCDG
jgi:hypothetical protein